MTRCRGFTERSNKFQLVRGRSEMHLPRRSVLLREQEPPLSNNVVRDGGITPAVYDARRGGRAIAHMRRVQKPLEIRRD